MKKLHSKHTSLLMTFFMSCFMALVMSGLITLINQGFNASYFMQWMHAYSIAWPTAFCVMFVLRPWVTHLVACCVDTPGK